jgi:hypothetical protein
MASSSEDSTLLGGAPKTEELKYGYLVHITRGEHNPSETKCFRRLCMRYGLDAWDEMVQYLPWKSRSNLRSMLCWTIKKQAIGDYQDIRADPLLIRQDNERIIAQSGDENCIVKGGVLVDCKWDRDPEERAQIRAANALQYGLSDEEELAVVVPNVIAIEYSQRILARQAAASLMWRAALLEEKMRREGKKAKDLGLGAVTVRRGKEVVRRSPGKALDYTDDAEKYMRDA